MMHVIKKWEILVNVGENQLVRFYTNDNYIQNVLRDLSKLDWKENINSITISLLKEPKE